MAKKYGIEVHHKDDTPGFRESYDTEEWFESEEERDKKIQEYYDSENQPLSPKDQLIENELGESGDFDITTYSKIEK
ncbi:hypothetical protein [Pediococcus argentinicus]|uniref:Uncharacterized protein n=1 Tax=Pediococcus argentinicus TaxID=480391 RepID=A0A0R2NIQ8_9LACO|nr:hypothetical protein [Pediococcus argentinicus]KRO25665.1 hypothetical protein IV88_GL001623 [Pediococcus argentinicus]NKZ21998.1 hypothetical protein [Pediococcus argentinicus]GEP19167.1 hypothetical protein LSA03_05510 [Pediococcus argentinicus]